MSLRERVEGALRGDPALAPPRRWARRWEEDSPLPSPPALDMSCDPYPYQRQAAHLLDSTLHERSLGNLLVASPTGSGKTFAIKWAAKRAVEMGWRLVVAVPLVALAEQIFAQLRALLRGVEPAQACPSDAFLDSFDDEEGYFDSCCDWTSGSVSDPESPVGIRTGPSEMFPDAPVLVCTYEVVLIQLNRSVSFFDRMPLLIIDEVHTIADPERGHVTENLINHPAIPPGVRFVGMSGTLPNALDLAEFMGRANRQPTWVVGARRRPIDITFYVHTLTHADQEGSDEAEGDRRTRSGALRKIYDTKLKAYTAPPEPAAALPARLTPRQHRHRVLRLTAQLESREMLPAMLVAFSCAGLDRTAEGLASVDLLPAKRAKARVHFEFERIKHAVPADEWELFGDLRELAKRGIGVHHSRKPKQYLELLPQLVRLGKVRMVLATSTLSAGIDLPVRTVVFAGGLRMPSGRGFRVIEPNLFHQICGRAGRPGLETEGNAVIAQWTESRVDLEKLVRSGSAPIHSQYRLTPSMVLNILIRADMGVEDLLRGSFGTDDQSHLAALLRECRQRHEARSPGADPRLLGAVRRLREAREAAGALPRHAGAALALRPGDRVLLDPEAPSLAVEEVEVREVCKDGSFVDTAGARLRTDWVFCVSSRAGGGKVRRPPPTLDEGDALARMSAALAALRADPVREAPGEAELEVDRLERWQAALRERLAPERLWLWPEYQRLLRVLRMHGFVDGDDIPQIKGRMASEMVAPDDGLSLVEAWVSNILPRGDPDAFGPLLTCFLAQPKHDQVCPERWRERFEALQAVRRRVWGAADLRLGCWMIEPMSLWMAGEPVSAVHRATGAPVGHFCKEVLRLAELLRQVECASEVAGDPELGDLSRRCAAAIARGLPFVPSLHLR